MAQMNSSLNKPGLFHAEKDKYRLLALSETPNNMLMWAYYCD